MRNRDFAVMLLWGLLALCAMRPAAAADMTGTRLDYTGDVIPVSTVPASPTLPGWSFSPQTGGANDLTGLSINAGALTLSNWATPNSLYTPTGVFDGFTTGGSTLEMRLKITSGKLGLVWYDGARSFQTSLEPTAVTWVKIDPPEAPNYATNLTAFTVLRFVLADGQVRIYEDGRLKLSVPQGNGGPTTANRFQFYAPDSGAQPTAEIDYIRIDTGANLPDPFLGDRLELNGDVVPVTSDPAAPNIPGWTFTPSTGGVNDLTGLSTDGNNLVLTEWPSPNSLFSPLGVFDDYVTSGCTLETRMQLTSGRLTFVVYDGDQSFQIQFRNNGVYWLKIDPAEAPSVPVDLAGGFQVLRFIMANNRIRIYVNNQLQLDDTIGNGSITQVSRLQIIALDGRVGFLPNGLIDYIRVGTGALEPVIPPNAARNWELY